MNNTVIMSHSLEYFTCIKVISLGGINSMSFLDLTA